MTAVDALPGILAVALVVVLWRLVTDPTDADRVVAVDLGFVVFVAAAALLAYRLRTPAALVLVLVATLIEFLTTLALAHLLERRSP